MAPRIPKAEKPDEAEHLQIEGHDVRISSPTKPYFTRAVQLTKLDIVRYFLSVAPGALRGIKDRPIVLKRFVNGAEQEPFYQKRAPSDLPDWMRTVTLSFPSGRTAEEVVVDSTAGLAWIVNLGCMELHPHPVSSADLEHPNELRVDLDPQPGIGWESVRQVAFVAKAVLEEHGLTAWVKTSGSRGMHLNAPIAPDWSFTEVRRAALALAREVERRAPELATSKWWKEERHGVFIDYNQNAKDRTTASAYSVRPLPDARVSAPLRWEEVMTCDPADFTVLTMPARFAASGDPHEGMDAHPGSLEALFELAARDEAAGLGDAPWPPHFAKQASEPKRVQPSKSRGSRSSGSSDATSDAGRRDFSAASSQAGSSSGLQPHESTAAGESNRLQPTASELQGGSSGLQATELAAGSEGALAPGSPPQPTAKHFADQLNEGFGAHRFRRQSKKALKGTEFSPPALGDQQEVDSAPERRPATKGRRASKFPLVIVSQSPDKSAAEAGLNRWRAAHPEAAQHLAEDDILVDRMRGSAYVWYRIRVNLRNVPEELRPQQGTPDPDDDPTRAWRERTNSDR